MRKMYPRPGDDQIVYLKDVITDPNIQVGGVHNLQRFCARSPGI